MPYLTLTLSVLVCLGAMTDASARPVNLDVRTDGISLRTEDRKLIANMMNELAKSVRKHKPAKIEAHLIQSRKPSYVLKSEPMTPGGEQMLVSDPGRQLHDSLLNIPPPRSI